MVPELFVVLVVLVLFITFSVTYGVLQKGQTPASLFSSTSIFAPQEMHLAAFVHFYIL